MSTRAVSVRRRRKVLAFVAGGMALGVAGMVTLAAWNDNEWVFGGTGPGGEEGVGTSEFNVEQNAWTDTVPTAASTFTNHENNPGNALMFNVDPTGLTPGTTIYAPVAMTTTANSIGGELQLIKPEAATGEVLNDDDGLLWDALTYSVRVTADAAVAENCTPAGFASAGDDIVPAGTGFAADVAAAPQDLSAERGNVQYYCFAITLPAAEADNADLQGLVVSPAWRFAAVSDD